jgi:hypothetical protein
MLALPVTVEGVDVDDADQIVAIWLEVLPG